MRVGLVPGVCEGHAQCYVVDADLFPLDEDGFSALEADREVPPGEEQEAEIGVAACPVRALRVLP